MLLFISLCLYQVTQAQCSFDPTITGEAILCPNSTETLSTQEYESYQWYRRGFSDAEAQPIEGDTSQTITVSNEDVLFYYSVKVTLEGCTEFSPEVLIDAWAFLPVTVASTGDYETGNNGEFILCLGDTMYFTLNLPYNKEITWFRDGEPIEGETETILVVTKPGDYTVTAAPGICPDYIQSLGLLLNVITIECTTGTDDPFVNSQVVLYPNPAKDQLTAESLDGPISFITVFAPNGKAIYQSKTSGTRHQINLSGFSPGFYLIEIQKKSGKERMKLIVQ